MTILQKIFECSITIKTPRLKRTHERFKDKCTEFDELENLLKSAKDFKFNVVLKDKEEKKREFGIT